MLYGEVIFAGWYSTPDPIPLYLKNLQTPYVGAQCLRRHADLDEDDHDGRGVPRGDIHERYHVSHSLLGAIL